jgi:hypothetical protein
MQSNLISRLNYDWTRFESHTKSERPATLKAIARSIASQCHTGLSDAAIYERCDRVSRGELDYVELIKLQDMVQSILSRRNN